jgi:RimJ/RimL family protein N-acetyltransferase
MHQLIQDERRSLEGISRDFVQPPFYLPRADRDDRNGRARYEDRMPTIRAAIDSDWPVVWSLFRAAAASGDVFAYDEHTTEETARKLWFEPPAACFVVEEGGIAGTYYIRPNQPGRGDHVANGGYIVAPHARGKGLAQRMCEHSIETARRLGFRAMQFNYVVATNAAAVRTWERCGFAVVGRLPGAFRHKDLGPVDVLVMYRAL